MNTRKTILCILLSIATVLSVRAQVRFTVEAPATTDINSEFRVVYKVEGAKATSFEAPSFADFEVLSGPAVSQFSSMSSVGGRTVQSSQSTTWTYILSPKRKGTFKLAWVRKLIAPAPRPSRWEEAGKSSLIRPKAVPPQLPTTICSRQAAV